MEIAGGVVLRRAKKLGRTSSTDMVRVSKAEWQSTSNHKRWFLEAIGRRWEW